MLVESAMVRHSLCNCLILLAEALVGVEAARADVYYAERSDDGYAQPRSGSLWRDEHVRSGIGVGIQAGGGVLGFVDPSLRDTTGSVGGMWTFRAAFGTHVPLGLEVAYVGSATPLDTEFGRADALMIGTGIESALRYNVTPRSAWSPYVFAGLGWQRFTIDDTAFQLSDTGVGNRDDLLVVPVGVGLSYRVGGFVSDVRGTFRAATGESLVLEDPALSLATGAGSYAPMHTWDASLNVGYEF
jgi:hypothetical protein